MQVQFTKGDRVAFLAPHTPPPGVTPPYLAEQGWSGTVTAVSERGVFVTWDQRPDRPALGYFEPAAELAKIEE